MLTRKQFLDYAMSANTNDCIIWPYAIRKSSGYAAYSKRYNGVQKHYDAHRFICVLAHGNAPSGMEAAHSCGVKICINPKHLSWKTPIENIDDAKRHGVLRGGGRYRQRIFDRDRAMICASKESHVAMAARYGVAPTYIGFLRRQRLKFDL